MPRSRSRDRRERSRSRDRRSRSRDRERRRSRDRDRDRDRRNKSPERYKDKRDRHERKRSRSYERHRNRSPDRSRKRRDSRDRRRSSSRSKRHRSNSSERKSSHSSKSQSNSVKPIVIIASANKKSNKNRNADNESRGSMDHRASFEISNEFSQEGFEQFSKDHGIDFTKIETDEDREEVHQKMEELLKAHFAAQGKVYPPPKVEKPVVNNVTGFANDGSFLEQFKKMQEEYKQQQESESKRQANDNLRNLPINKRRGAKILKTGLVAKTIVTPEGTIKTNAFDAYYKEVQKYKNSSSCDSDSKNRPLVK